MLGDQGVWSALRNSLYVALLSVLVNLVCGVPAALALPRVGRHSRLVFTVLLSLGLSSPTIVSAVAFFDVYGQLGLTGVGIAVAGPASRSCCGRSWRPSTTSIPS
jgi:ABC-type spermidine/putrescine transport system permease subunit II